MEQDQDRQSQSQNTDKDKWPQAPQKYPPVNTFHMRSDRRLWIIIPIVAALGIAGGVFGYWQYQQMQANKQPTKQNVANNSNYPVVITPNPNGNQLQPGDPNYPSTTPPSSNNPIYQAPDPLGSQACGNMSALGESKSGQVQWSNPQLVGTNTLFVSAASDSTYAGDYTYLVGHFTSGKYQGADLLLGVLNISEMGTGQYWYHIVRQGKNYTLLDKYSGSFLGGTDIKLQVALKYDKDFVLPDLEIPQTLRSDNPAADFKLVSSMGFFHNGSSFFCADNLVKVFTDANMGDVYTDVLNPQNKSFSNGFYVKSPDGLQQAYELNINFIGDDNVPLVIWSNGIKNTQEYSFKAIGGCGASKFMDVWDVKPADLSQIGTAFGGQPLYGYKDNNNNELKTTYDEIFVPDGQTKPSYSAFIAEHPIFFWQDPFGQFVRFKSMKYQPMAECAKPVIYLYPGQTEVVSVKINPQGGMTKSEPLYNNGWKVIADPQSNITNLADGKQYPYLFWEGRGGMYRTPDRGFMVAKADVHMFLENKLSLAGLNEKERRDFEQFWEPKMQDSPYYFVTLMGNLVMDELAPLAVTPKPDTVIRILMDFTPLDHPAAVEGYSIRTPERKGFTVVEWGGVLRSGQK